MSHLNPEQIDAFLTGELSAEDYAACEAHLQTCEACMALLQSERSLRKLLKLEANDAIPTPDSQRIIAGIDTLTDAGRRAILRRRWMRNTVWVAAIAVFVMILLLLRPVTDREEQRLAEESGLSVDEQRSIVMQLDALRVLREHSWLMDEEYETARLLVELVRQREGL